MLFSTEQNERPQLACPWIAGIGTVSLGIVLWWCLSELLDSHSVFSLLLLPGRIEHSWHAFLDGVSLLHYLCIIWWTNSTEDLLGKAQGTYRELLDHGKVGITFMAGEEGRCWVGDWLTIACVWQQFCQAPARLPGAARGLLWLTRWGLLLDLLRQGLSVNRTLVLKGTSGLEFLQQMWVGYLPCTGQVTWDVWTLLLVWFNTLDWHILMQIVPY